MDVAIDAIEVGFSVDILINVAKLAGVMTVGVVWYWARKVGEIRILLPALHLSSKILSSAYQSFG